MATPGVNSAMTGIKPPRPSRWQPAAVVAIRRETPRVSTIRLDAKAWPGHLAGQHADVRLIAEDGYRAERSYSIASPPEESCLELTVERIEAGEVSPYLTGELRVGDTIEIRGPIGGHFVWSAAAATRPLLLMGGGSGVAPLMCVLRHRRLSKSVIPAALLYSARTRDEVIYQQELETLATDPTLCVAITLTRDAAGDWRGARGRIDLPVVQRLLAFLGEGTVDSFVAGSSGFVERAADLILQAGQPAQAIRTERFGPTGTITA